MNWYDSITPTEFERLCMLKLQEIGKAENLQNFRILKNQIIKRVDGNYQIDVMASYTALNVTIIVLCECKRYKSSIKRDVVLALDGKVSSCGAHKGIVMAVNGFQTGAIKYAKEHGIGLINLVYSPDSIPPEGNNMNGGPFGYSDSKFKSASFFLPGIKTNVISAFFDVKDQNVVESVLTIECTE